MAGAPPRPPSPGADPRHDPTTPSRAWGTSRRARTVTVTAANLTAPRACFWCPSAVGTPAHLGSLVFVARLARSPDGRGGDLGCFGGGEHRSTRTHWTVPIPLRGWVLGSRFEHRRC